MNPETYRLKAGAIDVSIQCGLPSSELVADYASAGVELVVADIDATLTDSHNGAVCDKARDFANVAEQHGLGLALVTNNRDSAHVQSVAHDLAVPDELVFSPQRIREHKPTPTMLRKAMRSADVSPEATFAIGDGATDIISFLSSGIRRVSVRVNCPTEAKGYWLRPKVRKFEYLIGRHTLQLGQRRGLVQKI